MSILTQYIRPLGPPQPHRSPDKNWVEDQDIQSELEALRKDILTQIGKPGPWTEAPGGS